MTRRFVLVLAIVFCSLAVVPSNSPVSANDKWTSVRSKNFLLVGNASEKDIRQVAVRLEQFREVFSRLFPTMSVNSTVPTTVIVFKNNESYRPFKPTERTAGYFQAGAEVNYITLRLVKELGNEQDPFTIIFHEYTHLLVKNTSGNVPLWFDEGLAEYYSTFRITDDQKVVLGSPIVNHLLLLRERRMLPLRTLFQVDHKSPYYNEDDKQSIFYAESWALIHYLIFGKDGQRITRVGKFLELLSASVPMEQAFQQAFAMSVESMEQELRMYIQRDRYPVNSRSFNSKVGYDKAMQSAPITEAAAQAYLGDLLLKSNRADCEVYLLKALALDPDLTMANASLGMLRVRQGKSDEALKSLERALAVDSENYLIHYDYAYALSREGNRDMQTVMDLAPEKVARMRAELKRAIQLRPDFLESYSLLAFVNLVADSEIDETTKLLERAFAGAPNRNDLVFMLAQLYLRKQDFKTARQLINKLESPSNDAELRKRAQGLLTRLVSMEERLAVIRNEKEYPLNESTERNSPDAIGESIVETYDEAAALRQSLRKPAAGETQIQGALIRVDCDAKGITFVIKVNDRFLKLNTDSFRHMGLLSFSDDAGGQITCGPRKPENNVVVAYVPTTEPLPRMDGVVKAIEFVPQDFKLKP